LGSFTGMLMRVPSGRKNWSICSDMDRILRFVSFD
jgi:hypothetical protein